MESLLEPTIEDFFSELQFPEESCILQVVQQHFRQQSDGRYRMFLTLSDGRFSFKGFIITSVSPPPGENSLLRIPRSPANRVKILELKDNLGTFGFIKLGEYKKILDGAHCNKIGTPVELRDWNKQIQS